MPGTATAVQLVSDAAATVRREQRLVEVLRLGEHAAGEPVAGMRVERVGEALRALVGQRVGIDRRAQQAEAQLVAERVVAVLAVVEQRDAVAVLGQIGEAVRGHLEAAPASHDVLRWVGRRMTPCAHSKVAWSERMASGKRAFRRIRRSCQSMSVSISSRAELAQRRQVCTIVLSRKRRVIADGGAVGAALDHLDRARRVISSPWRA